MGTPWEASPELEMTCSPMTRGQISQERGFFLARKGVEDPRSPRLALVGRCLPRIAPLAAVTPPPSAKKREKTGLAACAFEPCNLTPRR